ncbi:MAG: TonB-dependent receptor [Pseudomonadota bacterium]
MTNLHFNRTAVRSAVRGVLAGGLLFGATLAAAAAEDQGTLEEVVVTAQFRQQSVQDTPLSITAISGDMLDSRSQTNIAEVASQAPNVTLKTQGAAFGPAMGASIRGIGQFDFNPALEPGVGLYVDDVYYATLTGSILDLLDVERVEVLRGPQGTLAGKNSIGGAIKIYSRKPEAEGGYVAATYGTDNRADIRASGNFAIADNLFARVSGVSKHQDGYVKRIDYGCTHPTSGVPILKAVGSDCEVGTMGDVAYTGLRGELAWDATENFKVSAAMDYTTDQRTPAAGVLVDVTTTVNPNVQPVQGVTNLPLSAFLFPKGSYKNYASFYNPKGTFTKLTPPAGATTPMLETRPVIGVDFEGWGSSVNMDWKLSDSVSLKSISAYREYDSYFANDNDFSPLANSVGSGDLSFHSFSQELRLNGALLENDRIQYTLGAFYMNQTSIYATTQDLRYSPAALTQFVGDDPINADTLAFFAHASLKITDKLSTNLGLRYTDEHKDYTFSRKSYSGGTVPALAPIDGLTTDYDGNKVDYRVNFQYDWTDQLMTYLQVATGFKGGGVSPRPFTALQAVPFDPEDLLSYELGIKSDMFDNTLRVNASIFYSKYSNLQLTLSSCPQYGVGAPCAVVANAGDADIKGAELEVYYRPVAALQIDASYSYLDFKYTDINPAAGGPTRPTGPQLTDTQAYTPKNKWSAGIQYDISLGDRGNLTPRLDVTYQGDIYTNGANRPTNFIKAYTLMNARVTWRTNDHAWETSLEATNLTNEYYFITRFDQFSNTGVSDGQPGRPREYALTVRRNF